MSETQIVQGSGGGCFKAGSLVQLENGKTLPIEQLKVGDSILSYNEQGDIEVSKVTVVHYHENPEPLLNVKFWKGSTNITPNHWVQNQYGTFVEVSSLTEEDAFIDGMGHLRPIISMEALPAEPVWNLTVEPNHTFIIDNIRVHNGGYRNRYPVAGSGGGGGKGGGGRAPIEDPDSLRSMQYARVIDLLSEGPIEGFVTENPLESIYLDGVKVSEGGQNNFKDTNVVYRYGTPDQTYVEGFSAVESETVVNVEVTKSISVVRTITNPDVDRARITIGFPRLSFQNASNGDMHGTTVKLLAELKPNGGDWGPAYCTYTDFGLKLSNTAGYTGSGLTSGTYAINTATTSPVPHNTAKVTIKWTGDVNYTQNTITTGGSILSKVLQALSKTKPVTFNPYTYARIDYREKGTSTWYTFKDDIQVAKEYVTYEATYDGEWGYSQSPVVPEKSIELDATALPALGNYEYRIITKNSGELGAGTFKFTKFTVSYPSGDIVVTGKSNSRYQASYIINLPTGQSPWQIRISRVTDDALTSNYSDKSYWDTYTEIVDAKLSYPNSAYIASVIDSKQFSSIPNRGYHIKGLKVQVPTNYNPITRNYTGVWDGTFKEAWTDNPAWCFYDLLTSKRYGLGNYLPGTASATKWELYTIARYCDAVDEDGVFQGVDDLTGRGTKEPRFTCNLYIQTRSEAYNVLNSLASIFRGIIYWANGSVLPVQDAPKDAVALYTSANILDGVFSYEGTSLKARHNVALVTWNDPNNAYKQTVEYVEDRLGIQYAGDNVNELEILAVGCTSRGQAYRVGKWALYSERLESETVTFRTGLDGLVARPGNIIKTMDHVRAGDRLGGRILNPTQSLTSLQLDSPVTLVAGKTYNLMYVLSNGTLSTTTVLNSPGTYDTLNISGSPVLYPVENSVWILSTDTVPEEYWRVISVKEEDNGTTASITALAHDPNKFDGVENGEEILQEFAYTRNVSPEAISRVDVTDGIYLNSGIICSRIYASWTPPVEARTYRVRYRNLTTNSNWSPVIITNSSDVEINNVTDNNNYKIEIIAVGSIGLESLPTYIEHLVLGKKVPPETVLGTISSAYKGSLRVSWNANTEVDIKGYEVRTSDTNWGQDTSYVYLGTETQFVTSIPAPGVTNTYYIKALDTTGNYSTVASIVSYTGGVIPVPPNFTYAISPGEVVYSAVLQWGYVEPEAGLKTYKIVEGSNTYYTTGTTYSIDLTWVGLKTFSITTVDVNNRESAVSTLGITISVPSNVLAPSLSLIKTSGNIQLVTKWDPAVKTSLPINHYEIRSTDASWGTTSTTNLVYKGASTSTVFANAFGIMGPSNYYYIRAYDVNGNYSATSTQFLLGLPDAPADITGFTAPTIIGNKLKFVWDESPELDVLRYEVRLNNTSWGTPSTTAVIYNSNGSSFEYTPPITPDALNFYIKAMDITNVYSTNPATQLFTYSQVPSVGSANIIQTLADSTSLTSSDLKLSWPVQSPQFGLDYYKVIQGTSTIKTKNPEIVFPADWGVGIPRVFNISVVDTNGKESTTSTKSVTIAAAQFATTAVPTATAEKIVGDLNLNISWEEAIKGTLPIAYYEVRWGTDNSWGTSSGYLYKGLNNSFSLQKVLSGGHLGKTVQVRAYDSAGYTSNIISLLLLQPGPPLAPANFYAPEVVNSQIKLSWDDSTSWDAFYYEVRTSDSSWGNVNSAQVFSGLANSCLITPVTPSSTLAQTTTYYIKTWDAIGTQSSAPLAQSFVYNTVTPVSITTGNATYSGSVTGTSVLVNWDTPSTQFPISHYELERGIGSPLIISNSTTYTTEADWGDTPISLGITVVDIYGKKSSKSSISLGLTKPTLSITTPTTTLTKTAGLVAANISWPSAVKGSLPIAGYEIRTTTTNWGFNDSFVKYKGNSNNVTVADGFSYLNQTWYLKVFDTQGNYSTTYHSILIGDVSPPADITFLAPTTSSKFDTTNPLVGLNTTTGDITLAWQASSPDTIAYDLRTQNPTDWSTSTAGKVYYGGSTGIDVEMLPNLTLPQTYTYYLKPKDVTGQFSTSVAQLSFTYTSIPAVAGINYTLFDDTNVSATIKVYWDHVSPQFGLQQYKIYDGINTYYTNNNYIELPANWLTSAALTANRTYQVTVIDTNDNTSAYTQLVVSLSNPSPVGTIQSYIDSNSVRISWPSNTVPTGGLPLVGYEVRAANSGWGGPGYVFKGSSSELRLPFSDFVSGSTSVSKTYYVKAIDTDNNYSYGTTSSKTITPASVPTPTGLTYSFFDDSSTSATITVKWNEVLPEFGLKQYKVTYLDSLGAANTTYTTGQVLVLPADWVGSRTFNIYAIDNRGVASTTPLIQAVDKYPPNSISQNNFSAQVIDNTVMLTWIAPANTTLPLSHYLVKSGLVVNGVEPTWDTAENDLGRKDGAFTTITEVAAGTYKYFIKPVDTDNVESVNATSRVCEVAEPPDFIFKGLENLQYTNTSKNTVITTTNVVYSVELGVVGPVNTSETWTGHYTALRVSTGTIVSGGAGYTTGSIIEVNAGTSNNSYKARFEVTAVSSGIVTGIRLLKPGSYSVAPTVASATTLISGSGSGLTITTTTTSWANPQAQITAGYPIYISPAFLDSVYEEKIDYGVVLASSKVTLRYSKEFDGAYPEASVSTNISISSDNTSWTTYTGVDTIFATNFRYVKITINISAKEGSSIVRIYGANVLLDAKLRNDADMVACNDASIDPLGSIANFNKEFVDITSLLVSPQTTVATVPVYDYKDAMVSGTYSVVGTTGTISIPNHGQLHGQNVKLYISSGAGSTDTYQVTGYSIASATSSGTTATINTTVAHGLIPGSVVTVTGATPSGYNGNYTLVSASASTMTITTTGSSIGAMTTLGNVTPKDKFLIYMPVIDTSGNLTMYSQGFRIYLFNQAGTRISGLVSWSAKGY